MTQAFNSIFINTLSPRNFIIIQKQVIDCFFSSIFEYFDILSCGDAFAIKKMKNVRVHMTIFDVNDWERLLHFASNNNQLTQIGFFTAIIKS